MNDGRPSAHMDEQIQSIGELIDRQAALLGGRTFLIDPSAGKITTYGELHAAVRLIAAAVASMGIKRGESVAYALGNGPECALTVLGLMYGGFRATAVNLVAGTQTIAYVLEHSQARVIITQPAQDDLLEQALEICKSVPVRCYAQDLLANDGADLPLAGMDAVAGDADGLLMYTSGTTGRPKGVVLTNANLVAAGVNAATSHELGQQDTALCILPLYHINGLCTTLLGPLTSGGAVVMPSRFSTSSFWKLIADHNCTWFSAVPTHFSYLLHDRASKEGRPEGLGSVRFGRSASAPLSPDVQDAFEQQFSIPIIETMGLTETAGQILSNPMPPGERKSGSPGVAFGNEVVVADEKQREVARGHQGEILVRGANVMREYLRNEEATLQALTADGWLRTGDLGHMDEDGYVFVTGRLKELIIKGGENIAPREIDEALYAHPEIIEAGAFARPSKDFGQTVEAAVMVKTGSGLTEDELLDFCRQRLGPVKTPDRIHFLAELPKGPSGKIQRIKIAEMTQNDFAG